MDNCLKNIEIMRRPLEFVYFFVAADMRTKATQEEELGQPVLEDISDIVDGLPPREN